MNFVITLNPFFKFDGYWILSDVLGGGYFALIRAAFGQRRKTAANAIAGGLNLPKEKVIAAIEASGFDARIRPEALTLADFAKIQQALA